MLRILLLLLALISVALAVILEMPWVLGIAVALVAALILVWVLAARKRRRKASRADAPAVSSSPDRELASLGISDIRPKGVSRQPKPESSPSNEQKPKPPSADAAPEKPERPAQEKPERPAPDGVRPATVQRLSTRRRQTNFSTIEDDRFAQIMGPYLQAIRASTGAQTVCLLKQDDVEPHYSIETMVSQNSYARTSGHFHTKQPYLTSASSQKIVVRNAAGEDGFDPSMLGYYREPIAVRQMAIVPVPPSASASTYILVADTMTDGELAEPYRQRMLSQFGDMLRSILDMIELEGSLDSGEAARPRREIIEEEMVKAREASEQMMFALVYLNRAEEIAADGRIAVAAAERALETALMSSEDRVDRFGELTYGVFRRGPEADVETWAEALQQQVASGRGALKGGASIGIVIMNDRHDTPESIREDATRALSEAFETGACTIVE